MMSRLGHKGDSRPSNPVPIPGGAGQDEGFNALLRTLQPAFGAAISLFKGDQCGRLMGELKASGSVEKLTVFLRRLSGERRIARNHALREQFEEFILCCEYFQIVSEYRGFDELKNTMLVRIRFVRGIHTDRLAELQDAEGPRDAARALRRIVAECWSARQIREHFVVGSLLAETLRFSALHPDAGSGVKPRDPHSFSCARQA